MNNKDAYTYLSMSKLNSVLAAWGHIYESLANVEDLCSCSMEGVATITVKRLNKALAELNTLVPDGFDWDAFTQEAHDE